MQPDTYYIASFLCIIVALMAGFDKNKFIFCMFAVLALANAVLAFLRS